MWFSRKKTSSHSDQPAPNTDVSAYRKDSVEDRRKAEAEAAGKAALGDALGIVDDLVKRHGAALVANRRRKLYRDDYGRLVDEAWQSEIEYFRLNIVDNELLSRCGPEKLAQATVQALVDTPLKVREMLGAPVDHYLASLIRTRIQDAVAVLDAQSPACHIDESQLSPADYEHLCAELLRASGWTVRVCGGSGDQGVDLVAERNGIRAVFQCKLYSNPVGNGAVQEVYTGKRFHGAHLAAVVSSAEFTPSARAASEQTGVLLLHHIHLTDFAREWFAAPPSSAPSGPK